ncbi:hypothetical protein Mal52_37230 [Symmachiella dynata]|uniref:Curli production assembly/transport component CsgG n=1 Tax=Symmachiella dynata TaxID=2527995 RepID=A0A517ZRW3_9PLAN|nr:hypothetical protein [Symmachiella dynata]QDU45232.1 hypothetical protein Mal52_37230 [Symmachiella dynata]
MAKMTYLALLSLLCGCASVQSTGRDALTSEKKTYQAAAVTVNLWQLPVERVPVSSQGATLRQVITQARDTAGIYEANRAIQNNLDFVEELFNVKLGDKAIDHLQSVVAGDECYVLVRGRQRFFFPEEVVYGSCVGQIRVLPSDFVLSIPYNDIDSVLKQSQDSGPERLTILVPVVNERFEPPPKFYEKLDGDIYGKVDERLENLKENQLRPTVVVVTRIGQWVDQVFVPTGKEIAFHSTGFMDERTFNPIDGDILEFIRVENHPLVAAALLSPAPPPAPAARTPVACDSRKAHHEGS